MRTVKQKMQKTAKSEEEPAQPSASDRLLGVPGLGPIRITALHAAGITTRAQLAQASVEQLISMTGMQRTYAEKSLAAVRGTASAATTPPPPTDELMPTQGTIGESADRPDAPELSEPESSPASDLDRALLTARTALADATRHFPALDRPLIKLARRLEKLPHQAASLSEKKQTKIAARLDKLSAHLEKASLHADKFTNAKREHLQKRIESEEEKLMAALPTKKERRSKHE